MERAIVINKDLKAVNLSDEEMLDNLERNLKHQIRHGSTKFLKRARKTETKEETLIEIDQYILQLSNKHANYISKVYLSPKIIKKNRAQGKLGPIKQITEIQNFGILKMSYGTTFERYDGKEATLNMSYLYDRNRPRKLKF